MAFPFCEGCTIAFNPILPDGGRTPKIYFIAETPANEEVKEGKPLIGPSGQILRKAIEEIGIPFEDYRLFNAVACKAENGDGSIRNPTAEEIQRCSVNFAHKDIVKCNPKVIVPLGASALSSFYPDNKFGGITKARNLPDLEFEGMKVTPSFHPSYILRQGGVTSPSYIQFKDDIDKAYKIALGKVIDKPKTELETIQTFSYFQVDEFITYVRDHIVPNSKVVALDYEGSSLEPLSIDFKLGGLSLSNERIGSYLWFKHATHYEYGLTEEVAKKVGALLKELDDQGLLVVYNLKYEVPATYRVFNVNLLHVIDCMQYTIPLNAKGSLKDNARSFLRVGQWEKGVEEYKEAADYVLQWLKPTKKFRRKEEICLTDEGIDALVADLSSREDDKAKKMLASLQTMEKSLVLECIGLYLRHKVQSESFELTYDELPLKLVATYCGFDGIFTVQLYLELVARLEAENLLQAAKYYNQQIYLGMQMESAGCCWDDVEASRIEEEYDALALDCLRRFLLVAKVSKLLGLSSQDIIEIQSSTSLDVLKKFFNPDSSHKSNTSKLSEILITARVRICLIAWAVYQAMEANEKDCRKLMPFLSEWVDKLLANEDKQAAIQIAAKEIQQAYNDGILKKEEYKKVSFYSDYQLESADAATIDVVVNATVKFMGVDIEKPHEAHDDYKVIFYHKYYKKLNKSKGTFLNGKVGRQAVSVISKDIMDPTYPIRIRPYSPIQESEILLWSPSLNVNGAITRRWTSGSHNIPPSSDIRRCTVSKYEDGLIFHNDYSQNELRVLAAMAFEALMLEAFKNGADIHRFNASLIFSVPEDKVEGWQRSWAKNATFGIVYGQSERSLADQFLNGDVAKAKWIMDTLYNRFPKIREFIEDRKREVKSRGYVNTIWGDPIPIVYDPMNPASVAEAERTSVNYPIQGSSSNIAALSIARVNGWLIDSSYRSRCFMFTHDSMDIDTDINEVFALGAEIPIIAEKMPLEEFGLPIQLDMSLGVSMYDTIELKGVDGSPVFSKSGDGFHLYAYYEGDRESLEKLVDKLSIVSCVSVDEREVEDHYTSFKRVFALKGGLEGGIGQTKKVSSGIITATYRG